MAQSRTIHISVTLFLPILLSSYPPSVASWQCSKTANKPANEPAICCDEVNATAISRSFNTGWIIGPDFNYPEPYACVRFSFRLNRTDDVFVAWIHFKNDSNVHEPEQYDRVLCRENNATIEQNVWVAFAVNGTFQVEFSGKRSGVKNSSAVESFTFLQLNPSEGACGQSGGPSQTVIRRCLGGVHDRTLTAFEVPAENTLKTSTYTSLGLSTSETSQSLYPTLNSTDEETGTSTTTPVTHTNSRDSFFNIAVLVAAAAVAVVVLVVVVVVIVVCRWKRTTRRKRDSTEWLVHRVSAAYIPQDGGYVEFDNLPPQVTSNTPSQKARDPYDVIEIAPDVEMHSTQQRPRPRQKDDPYDQVEIDSQFVSAQKPDTDNAFTDSKARFRIKTDPYDEVEEQVGTGTFCFKKTDPYDQTGHSNGSQEPFRREMSDPYDRVADDITRPKQNRFQVKGDYQHLSLKSDARNQTSKAVEGDSSKVGNVYSRIGAPGVLKTTDAAGTDTDDSVDVYNRLKTAEQRPQNSTSSDDSYHRIGDIDVLKTTREVCSSDYNRVVRTKGTGTTHDIVTQVEAMDSQQATTEIEQNGYSRFSKRTSVRDRSTIKDNYSHIGRSEEREKTALTETDGQ